MLSLLFFSTFLIQPSLSSMMDPITFSFPSFNSKSCSNGSLICMGSVTAGDGYLSITPELQNQPPNSQGFYLGLLDRSTEGGVVRQLAVELDTYKNEFDPDENHIGIDTTSMTNPVAAKSLDKTNINLKSGQDIKVQIDYDVPNSVFVGFTASTRLVSESHKVIDWAFTSVPLPFLPTNKGFEKKDNIKTIVIIVTTNFMVLLVILISCMFLPSVLRKLRNKNQRDLDIESRSRNATNAPKMFTYKQLSKAARNFSKENLLVKGGFGIVYKGIILVPPKVIAVKKISATSKQGLFYFYCIVS
nr:putative l-type lectin-domain containing receptor kinase s.5 [Quercus suber]